MPAGCPRSVTVAPRATTASNLTGARACKTLGAKLLGTFSRSLPGAGGRSAPDHRLSAICSLLATLESGRDNAAAASGGLAAESEPGDRIAELGVQDVEGDYQRSKPHDERAQEHHDDAGWLAPPGACRWPLTKRPSL